jgi:predicted phosphodiesterase
MSILVISDIHSNLAALQAVLHAAGEVDAVWCLGDLIGYGPNPNECVELIQEQPNLVCLLGNHDAASIGTLNVATFNREARLAVEWTQSVLSTQNAEFLLDRPHVEVIGNVDENKVSLTFPQQNQPIQLKPRSIVNPGSVGQPRDRDRRAAFAIFDPDEQTWTHRRVEYDIQATQEDMRTANLPDRHIERLNGGW